MPDVTVLGAGGATVTIALTSAQNAAAAQTALKNVSGLVTAGILDQITWSGSGTLPAPQNLLGGAIISTPGDAGALSSQNVSVVVNAKGNSTVVGPQNFNATVVAGDGSNLTYGNLSQIGTIFFGDSNGSLLNFEGTANLQTGKGNYVVETDVGATSNVKVGDGALVLISDLAGVSGANKLSLDAGAKANIIAGGSSTVPATITATAGDLFFVNQGKGNAIINPGAANVTVVGNTTDLGGRATVFGGTGPLTVSNGQGEFTGGTGGGNLLFTSTVAGSATLTGGGSGDVLFTLGQGNLLIAGAGSETLVGVFGTGGNTYITGNGFSTVFGGGQGGNTYLFAGLGSGLIDGRDEKAAGAAFQNTYQDFTSPGGTHLIGDFLTGTDKLIIGSAVTADITFFTAGQTGSPFGAAAGTQVKLDNGTTYNFFDTKGDGLQDIFQSDVVKL